MYNSRILHVIGGLGRGGAETWLAQVLPRLVELGYQVDTLVFNNQTEAYTKSVIRAGGRILRISPPSVKGRFIRELKGVLSSEGPFDVVHSHVWLASGIVMCLAKQAGVKMRITHSRNTSDKHARSLPRRIYATTMRSMLNRYATHAVGITEAAGESLFGTRRWASDGIVIPTALDLNPFRTLSVEKSAGEEFGIKPEAFVVGHVGSFSEQKNHVALIRIFAALKNINPQSVLLLVGSGPLEKMVRREAAESGYEEDIKFVGPRDDVPRLMKSVMDAFLFPSKWEGLGRVIVEAQAAGVPCIISDVVPRDADVIPSMVWRVSLDEPPERWAHIVNSVQNLGSEHLPRSPLAIVEDSAMNIENTIHLLDQLYKGVAQS